MKTVVVLSDTHRNLGAINAIFDVIDESDAVFHLGDCYQDMDGFADYLGNKLYRVHGNCDYGTQKEIIVEIEECKILATHGDLYGVKSGTERILRRAKELGCNIVLFGHTHSATVKEIDGVTIINPGTLQNMSVEKTFCYLVINGKKAVAVLRDLPFENQF